MHTRPIPTFMILATALLLALALVAPALAQAETVSEADREPEPSKLEVRKSDGAAIRAVWSARRGAIVVYHGPVDLALTAPGSDGHLVGDTRVASVATTSAAADPVGRLDIIHTTTGVDVPAQGDETRISTFVFTFGGSGRHQISTLGSAYYPAGDGAATGEAGIVSTIVGGSGRFAGAGGNAVSQRQEDGSWKHTLTLHRSRADALIERAFKQRLKDGLREWRAERKEARAERKGERKAERAERKAARQAAREGRRAEREAAAADDAEAGAEEDEEPEPST